MKIVNFIKKTLSVLAFTVGIGQAADVWVSDEVEAPLRAKPELNAKIVTLLAAGQRVAVLAENDDYVKIKAADGKVGWLPNYYVLRSISVHEQLAPVKKDLSKALEKIETLTAQLEKQKSLVVRLQSDNDSLTQTASEVQNQVKTSAGNAQKLSKDNGLLQTRLSEQSEKMTLLAQELDKAKERASTARTQYLSLVKVSENAVEIDKQNRSLQQSVVASEQEIQQLKNENQTLKAQLNTRQTMITALLIFGGILIGYVLSVLMPPRGRRASSNYNSSF